MNIDQALRDAAEPVRSRVAEPSAQALLDRIVATPVVPAQAGLRRPRKLVIAAVAAVAAAVGALTLPTGPAGAAYASWSPQPSPLAAADQDRLADGCVAKVNEQYQYREADRSARTVHAERRGDYAYLSVANPDWTALCFRDHDGTLTNASIMMQPVGATALGGAGVELQGWSQLRTEEGYCRLMAGHVGSRVVGVDITVRAADGSRTVRATVADGYFLAWYPEGVEEAGTNTTSLTLRLSDGSTVDGLRARDLMEAPRLK